MVKAWRECITIPTYEVGAPEKNPIFLEKRVYQGSSGVVYPYKVIESMADEPTDKTYEAVWMENEYLKIMILPELGGRVQMAYDKLKQRHFIYYNHVIKPALVGLAGPWISGGIEFNWPQHHRPSTFMPVDCTIETNDDGSVTVWVNEQERMFHQKGMAGFTLRSGCAYLEIQGVVCNPTELPQTFLWWANPAVAVNDHYQSVFPPDVNAVFDHGKRAVSSFPIATGTYYKMDYSAGVDISNYKNIKVPTSYMVARSRYNFEGGYENDTQAGMLHVADHHVSPGKKQWTWGNGDFGRAWDRNLTDADGPYIELMAGVYTENQPDFSWLMPYEEKSFVQYFMPYRELGLVKNASKDLMLNVEPVENGVKIKIFATSAQHIRLCLHSDDSSQVFLDKEYDVSPETVLDLTVDTHNVSFDSLTFEIQKDGRTVLDWHAEPDDIQPIPDAAEAAMLPQDIKTNEQLYLTGLHLEQYRHATWNATDYYEEALRRDPLDVRCNNQMGLWFLRRGRFDKAEPYLRTAVRVLQKRNPNPYDGEPLYNLGLCLKYQGRIGEAYDWFYKSTWNAAWQDAGYLACAQISCLHKDFSEALYEVDHALVRNWHNHKARALRTAILRHLGRNDEALEYIEDSLHIDLFNFGCRYERFLLTNDAQQLQQTTLLMRHDSNNYDTLALDYIAAGLVTEALKVWHLAIEEGAATALTDYYIGWAEEKVGIDHTFQPSTHAVLEFPNRIDAIAALQWGIHHATSPSLPAYLLGNLYYDKRQYDVAEENWELAAHHDDALPAVFRNLALLRFNKQNDSQSALQLMEHAFALDPTDARIFMELDQLRRRLHHSPAERLQQFEKHHELVQQRDDLILEHVTLLNQLGRYAEAQQMLDAHIFHPWEGGEGKVSGQYQLCRLEQAKQLIARRTDLDTAIRLLTECLTFPPHLGEGKLYGAQDNDFYYFIGICHHLLGDGKAAQEAWQRGTEGPTEPAAALYYNDAKPDKIFYAALCYRALGNEAKARGLFNRLVTYGEQHLFDHVTMDYFAVSLPDLLVWEDNLDRRNAVHCHYLLALGFAGLGQTERSAHHLDELAKLEPQHPGIHALQSLTVDCYPESSR